MEPLHNRVILKPVELETTNSGIYMPLNENEQNKRGIVHSSGKSGLTEGVKVIYDSHKALKVNYEGEELIFVPIEELIAC